MRRTVMRYVNLSLVLTLRMVSPRVKMRFPTMEHLVEAGFLQPNEMKIFEDLERKTNHPKYWMPLVWASSILTRARKENRITNDFSLKTLIDELNIFRAGCGKVLSYDWISIPLVYTQVCGPEGERTSPSVSICLVMVNSLGSSISLTNFDRECREGRDARSALLLLGHLDGKPVPGRN